MASMGKLGWAFPLTCNLVPMQWNSSWVFFRDVWCIFALLLMYIQSCAITVFWKQKNPKQGSGEEWFFWWLAAVFKRKVIIKREQVNWEESKVTSNLHHVLEGVGIGVCPGVPFGFAYQNVTLEEEDMAVMTFPCHSGSWCSFPHNEVTLEKKAENNNGSKPWTMLWHLSIIYQPLNSNC